MRPRPSAAGPHPIGPVERGEVRLGQAGPSGRDTGPAALPAAREARQAKAIVGRDDRGPAQRQLARQLALGGQAGARGQGAEVDGAGECCGQLLVERIRSVRPGPMMSASVDAETIDCLLSPLVSDWLLDWSLMRA